MKKLFLSLVMVLCAVCPSGATVVVDTDGEPMTGAIVKDNKGKPVGIIDEQGMLPPLNASLYPVTVSCMGFDNAVVTASQDTVVMKPSAVSLTEVVVKPGDHPGMYVQCYVRETSTMSDGTDSICLKSQYMVDYMLPAFNGAKCKTWKTPRVLAEEDNVTFTTEKAPDKTDIEFMKYYKVLGAITNDRMELPETMKGMTQGSDSRKGKFGSETIYRLTPVSFNITRDGLADRKDHTFSLPLLAIFGLTMDITELWSQRTFVFSEDERYDLTNTSGIAYSLKINGRGKGWKLLFPSGKIPVTTHTYIEIYPVEISYVTKEEAKALKQDPPIVPFKIPATVPSK